jgi:hypothetical protein
MIQASTIVRKESQIFGRLEPMCALKLAKPFSNLFDFCWQLMDTTLASALIIFMGKNTAQIQTKDSNGDYFEGFVHAPKLLRLGSFRRVFPEDTLHMLVR